MNYTSALIEQLKKDPRFNLLGSWKNCLNDKAIDINIHSAHFYIFLFSDDENVDFMEESELYPLHFDRENSVFYFYRQGIRTELLIQCEDGNVFLQLFADSFGAYKLTKKALSEYTDFSLE